MTTDILSHFPYDNDKSIDYRIIFLQKFFSRRINNNTKFQHNYEVTILTIFLLVYT